MMGFGWQGADTRPGRVDCPLSRSIAVPSFANPRQFKGWLCTGHREMFGQGCIEKEESYRRGTEKCEEDASARVTGGPNGSTNERKKGRKT